jgi:hypothetical protein
MNVNAARDAYAAVLVALRKERSTRDRVLTEPRRTTAIAEMDAAIDALGTLGKVIWMAVDAGLLAEGGADDVAPGQPVLLEMPNVDYP